MARTFPCQKAEVMHGDRRPGDSSDVGVVVGRRVFERGCGSAPVRLRRLTDESLADNLADLTTNRAYLTNAAHIGEALRAEDGAGKAIRHIERVIANYRPRNEQRSA